MPSITVVYDHSHGESNLMADFGFAAVVDTGEAKILFDTGRKGDILLSNLAKAGITPAEIQMVVLSHDHGDHTGGLETFLDQNSKATVHLPMSFSMEFKQKLRRQGIAIKDLDMTRRMCDAVYSSRALDAVHHNEMFRELGLICRTNQGSILLTGCAHPGLIPMVKDAREKSRETVYMLMGGFHLRQESEESIAAAVTELKELGVTDVCACHCTGEKAEQQFQQQFGTHFQTGGVGTKVEYQIY